MTRGVIAEVRESRSHPTSSSTEKPLHLAEQQAARLLASAGITGPVSARADHHRSAVCAGHPHEPIPIVGGQPPGREGAGWSF